MAGFANVRKMFAAILITGSTLWQGCEKEETPEPVDCSANPVELSVVSVSDANCLTEDGSIEVLATGGTGSYEYSIDEGTSQTSAVFNNVGAGVYSVTAIDDNNCSATIQVPVKNSNGMNIDFEATGAGCKKSEGTITVVATDGEEPYQFKVDNGAFSENNSFAGLATGEHQLVVTDASGCEITQNVRVPSGVKFSSSISPIIENKCAINSCHNGTQFPDFRVFNNVKSNAGQIKTLTGNGTMPQEGSLTQEEIDLIACWVDDGAPQN